MKTFKNPMEGRRQGQTSLGFFAFINFFKAGT